MEQRVGDGAGEGRQQDNTLNRDPMQHPEPSSSAGSIGNMEQEGADKAQSSRMWQLCSSTRLQRSVCEEGPR